MRRIASLAAIAAISLGCHESSAPTAPIRPSDTQASAAVVTNRMIDAFVFAVLRCGTTFEQFQTAGKLHILLAVETDSDGGTHFKVHINSAQLTGKNIKTGEEIQLRFVNNIEANGRLDGARESTMMASSTATIGEGPEARHYNAHVIIHVTFNANGEPTAVVREIHLECR